MPNISSFPILIIDDETQYLQSAAITLRVAGFEVTTISDPNRVLDLLKEKVYGVILLDILMPGIRGDELLELIISKSPFSAVIMSTAVNDIEIAINCMRKGAFDYLLKPIEKERLITTVKRAIEIVELKNENKKLKEGLFHNQLKNPEIFENIVSRDNQMFSIFRYIEAIAQTPMPVLIRGETGTGKELIAEAIHKASGRNGEFVCINAAGMSDTLFNDAMFGHEKGAFTGADSKRAGLVAKANGGTLFLDEIGDIAIESQIKLLRLLEERTYYPTGSDTPRVSDTRIISATNRDLDQMRKEGRFRDDLYFRLEAHMIDIPPLRKRKNDIPLLIDYFSEKISLQLKKEPPIIDEQFFIFCSNYEFPGNIRELRNILTDAISLLETQILTTDLLPSRLKQESQNVNKFTISEFNEDSIKEWKVLPAIKEAEQLLVDEALRRSNGNQTIAAQLLGMTRAALNKRLTRARQDQE